MKVYNTLSKQKEVFEPLHEGQVSMYVCGPTVYNYIHIGNARPMIVFDTVRRYFEYKGYEVNFVSNFTDIDDKIIKKAIEEGVSAGEISERYIKECKKDMASMNVKPATKHPLATEEVCGMVDMIADLIQKGFAYEKAGTVYFRTRKFEEYGKLSHKNLDDLQSGKRSLLVSGQEEKEDSLDFVLWKPKKEGEPAWDSPWSDGRPGWHIECSVMAKKYLGERIDIHAGGEDLVFPHHENEIAQSEAANGAQFAKYWLHNAFLNIDNRKMSKSSGNFFTVREIGEQYDLQVLRFFMLSAHYRSPLNFSADLMEASKNGLGRILNAVENLKFLLQNAKDTSIDAEEKKYLEQLSELKQSYENAMDDDFNTADAISAIFEIVKLANTTTQTERSMAYVKEILDTIILLSDILGLIVNAEQELLEADIENLIEERQQARKNKDFARADEIRDELLAQGIVLEDTREGVKWKKA
jgi:cysteinyl-tRNA synthetase